MSAGPIGLKAAVAAHWQTEPCGVRGITHVDRQAFFRQLKVERYAYEPHIERFARFADGCGKRVLEIGVGAGSDYINWLRAGSHAVGMDLTEAAVKLTLEHAHCECQSPTLTRADCESLPFRAQSFDIVYSYGVIHHSPNTAGAVAEIHRVLKTGGVAKVMIYHTPSITGLMLWIVHCLLKLRPWKSARWAVANFLESPGTKVYSTAEAARLFNIFSSVRIETVLGTGDLLLMKPSPKYQGAVAAVIWRLYPRGVLRMVGKPLGLGLLVEAMK
jgi:SAM-dependent methyltransferase